MVITVRIGRVVVPGRSHLEATDLGARVSAEVADMLVREPLACRPRGDVTVSLPGGPITVASSASASAVAHAIARAVVSALRTRPEVR